MWKNFKWILVMFITCFGVAHQINNKIYVQGEAQVQVWQNVPHHPESPEESLKIFFFNFILEIGEGREKERARNINVRKINWLPPVQALTRDQTHNPGMCPNQESNW